MRTSDAVLFALENLASHRLRTGLSTLGMMFGVAAVIAMLAIGEGAQRQTLAMIERLGIHNVLIVAKEFPPSEIFDIRKKSMGLSSRDVTAITEAVPHVELVAPKATVAVSGIIAEGQKTKGSLFGVTHRHAEVTRLPLEEGRFIDELDERIHAQVCVIGADIRRDLFLDSIAVGQAVKVGDVWLRVIGVLRSTSADMSAASAGNRAIYTPLTTLVHKFETKATDSPYQEIVVKLDGRSAPHEAQAVIAGLLKQLHSGVEDYDIIVPEALLAQNRETQRIFSIVMGCIAGISLLVGGIGIMNIMLASVFEQTREIGVRRAVGALRRDIRFQFLIESFLVACSGGLFGVALGMLISRVVANSAGWPTVITPSAVLLATGVSGAVGLFSGLYPAVRASKLDPIVALQHH